MFFAKIDPVAFRIGAWPVRWYGLLIGLGMVIAYSLFMREVRRKGMDEDQAFDLMFWAIVIGFIGARLYYVLFSWEAYHLDPISILFIWQGGLAIYGGVIAGGIVLYYFARRYQQPLFLWLDMAVPSLMFAQSIGRWGNFINQEAYGRIVDLTSLKSLHLPQFMIEHLWIEGAYREPTFLYESLWNLFGGLILLCLRRMNQHLKLGEMTCFYLIWYGIGRSFIEGLRSDSLYFAGFRISQVVSILMVVGGIMLGILRRKNPNIPYYSDSNIM